MLSKDQMSGARGGGVQDPAMMWCLEGVFRDFELRWWGFGVKAVTPDAVYIQPDPAGTFTLNCNFVGL